MSGYVDLELSQALTLAGKALIDLEQGFDAIQGFDLDGGRDSVQKPRTAGMVLMACDEPYAVVRMEDVWVEFNVLDEHEKKVVAKAIEMLTFPHRFVVDGS